MSILEIKYQLTLKLGIIQKNKQHKLQVQQIWLMDEILQASN